jgi:hypothetical protein
MRRSRGNSDQIFREKHELRCPPIPAVILLAVVLL